MTDFATRARSQKMEDAHAIGIDDALVSALVEHFYDRIRAHPKLGPIFAARVDQWPKHLSRMKDFWASIAIESGRFHGNPMIKHIAIAELRPDHFSDWLALWAETVDALAPTPGAAAFFKARADRIADRAFSRLARTLGRDRRCACPDTGCSRILQNARRPNR